MGTTDGMSDFYVNGSGEAMSGAQNDLRQSGQQFADSSARATQDAATRARLAASRAAPKVAQTFGTAASQAGGAFGSAEQYANAVKPAIDKVGSITSGIASRVAPYVGTALKGANIAGGLAGVYQASGDFKDTVNDISQGHSIGAMLNGVNTAADVAGAVPFGPVGSVARAYTVGRDAGGYVANKLISDEHKDDIGGGLARLDGSVTDQEVQGLKDANNFKKNLNAGNTPQMQQEIDARRAQQAVDNQNRIQDVVAKNEAGAQAPQSYKDMYDENGRPIAKAIPPTQVSAPSITSGMNINTDQSRGKDIAVDTGGGTFNVMSSGGNNYNGPAYAPSQPNQYQSSVNSLIGQLDNSTGGDLGSQVTRGLHNKATLAKINDIGNLNAKANENQIAMGHLGVSQQDLGIKRQSNVLHAQSNANQERRTDLMDRNSLANTANRTMQIDNQADAASDRNKTAQNRVDVSSRGVDNQENKTAFQIGKNGSLNGGENIAYQNALKVYGGPTGAGYGKSPADQDADKEKIRKSFMARGAPSSGITGGLPRPGAPMTSPSPAGTVSTGNPPVGTPSTQSIPADAINILKGNPGSAALFEKRFGLAPGASKQYLQ